MGWENPSNDKIKTVLQEAKTIAVVGLSNQTDRTSYQIAEAMQKSGYKIIPVNPMIDEVLGEKAYASLAAIDQPFDIINVFRRSVFLPDIAQEAIDTNCRVFWAQQGIVHEKAYETLKENDFIVIMDLCIKVAHAVL